MTKSVKPIRLVVGLGNPGGEYEGTRHNAGFWFVDQVASVLGGAFRPEAKFQGDVCRIQSGSRDCWLLKPQTYMNRSGRSVIALASYYKIGVDEILVAHDELDLDPGVARLKRGGGHGGHNGLRDISAAIGKEFYRLRLGIGHPGDSRQVTDFVLKRPSQGDRRCIEDAMDATEKVLALILAGDFGNAMNDLHSR